MIDRIRRALPKKLFLTEFHSNNETFEKCSILFKFKQGETDMGDKGKKDIGKREQKKKAQLNPKEKRKLKKEKQK